ncbi:hypothetical protein DMI69_08205 [Escherichia coli]|nr:hypothetical protein [Escherichia coli]
MRFVYQRDMPNALVEVLREKLTISRYDSIVPGGRYHNFKDFINFQCRQSQSGEQTTAAFTPYLV